MQIKITMIYSCTPIRIVKHFLKKGKRENLKLLTVGKEMEQTELSALLVGEYVGTDTLENC